MRSNAITKGLLLLVTFVAPLLILAQDGAKIEVDIDRNDDTWYQSPVVWVVGAAVFILLLVALLRGGRSKS